MDEAYGASRVDRHLANRAMSVRESSKPHSQDVRHIPYPIFILTSGIVHIT